MLAAGVAGRAALPAGYAGTPACAACHRDKTAPSASSAMARALEPVSTCAILRDHPRLTFRDGPYSYEIVREGGESVYHVSDGRQTLTVTLAWAFGLGAAGQTYVFERGGQWYESRVSFFNATQRLDHTIGATSAKPRSIDEAAGRLMSAKDAQDCFGCHSTGGVHGQTLDVQAAIPGIQCENCHGPEAQHVEAIRRGDARSFAPRKLEAMTTEEVSDFCGQCHRTWAQIASDGPRGVPNVRFQPYRLANSKCYDAADPRIRCTACHDPHGDLERDISHYDTKCLACHASGAKPRLARAAPACPVGHDRCASCHMPKIELPGAHYQFADHQIRIARKNDPYPN